MPNQIPRVTVVNKVYHQSPGSNPTHIPTGFTRFLKDREQVFDRTPSEPLSTEWQHLELAWFEKSKYGIGMVIIYNRSVSPKDRPLNDEDEMIYVKFEDSEECFVIPPQEDLRMTPSNVRKLVMRSRSGTAKYGVTILPG